MTKELEYVMVLRKLEITHKLLRYTVQDLDIVRNKEVRTDYDKEMLTWLHSIRTPIEDEMNKLETYRHDLWSELKKSL